MTKIAIVPNAAGTGTFTIEAPNSNSNRTLVLPDAAGELFTNAGGTLTGPLTGTDITLSGGVFLGGTASANLLDDYEEGTWTPTFSAGSFSNITNFTYTKIGRTVHITGYLASPSGLPSSGLLLIGGLPFAGNVNFNMSLLWYSGSSAVIAAAYLNGGGTALQVRPIGGAPNTFIELSVQMTYITNA
jgi:hypothetical protein